MQLLWLFIVVLSSVFYDGESLLSKINRQINRVVAVDMCAVTTAIDGRELELFKQRTIILEHILRKTRLLIGSLNTEKASLMQACQELRSANTALISDNQRISNEVMWIRSKLSEESMSVQRYKDRSLTLGKLLEKALQDKQALVDTAVVPSGPATHSAYWGKVDPVRAGANAGGIAHSGSNSLGDRSLNARWFGADTGSATVPYREGPASSFASHVAQQDQGNAFPIVLKQVMLPAQLGSGSWVAGPAAGSPITAQQCRSALGTFSISAARLLYVLARYCGAVARKAIVSVFGALIRLLRPFLYGG